VHVKYVCIASLYNLSHECFAYCCGTIFSILIVSLVCLEIFLQVHSRDDRESISLLFLSWYSQTSFPEVKFALTYMICLYICSFLFKHVFVIFLLLFSKKRGGGFDARFLLKVSALSCIFICFNSSLCFDRIYIHMLKFLSRL
jgi:hypothetical protein